MSNENPRRIGELNGPWAFLLKVMLGGVPIFLPFLIGWAVWVTQRIATIETSTAINGKGIEQVDRQLTAAAAKVNSHDMQLAAVQTTLMAIPVDQLAAHEAVRQRVLNDVGTLVSLKFDTKFDEISKQLSLVQKDVARVQVLLERRGGGGGGSGSSQ